MYHQSTSVKSIEGEMKIAAEMLFLNIKRLEQEKEITNTDKWEGGRGSVVSEVFLRMKSLPRLLQKDLSLARRCTRCLSVPLSNG
ncbi:hypothetical protein L204_102614 [Cryptococcus depauperatus]